MKPIKLFFLLMLLTSFCFAQKTTQKQVKYLPDSLRAKELKANKDNDTTLAGNSATKYPTQRAVKKYVDNSIDALGMADLTGVPDSSLLIVQDGVLVTKTKAEMKSILGVKLTSNNTKTVGAQNCDYTSIQSAVTASDSGGVVLVCPGTYSGQVTLKNGVDIECLGNVTITSSNPSGTIKDDSVACTMRLKGFPTIINTYDTLSPDKRIVLKNSQSFVDDFWWEYIASLTQSEENAPVAKILKNTIGNIIWSRSTVGYYKATLNNAFKDRTKILIIPSSYIYYDGGTDLLNTVYIFWFDEDTICYMNYSPSGMIDGLGTWSGDIPLQIRVYP